MYRVSPKQRESGGQIYSLSLSYSLAHSSRAQLEATFAIFATRISIGISLRESNGEQTADNVSASEIDR